jgi:hypothetical protein
MSQSQNHGEPDAQSLSEQFFAGEPKENAPVPPVSDTALDEVEGGGQGLVRDIRHSQIGATVAIGGLLLGFLLMVLSCSGSIGEPTAGVGVGGVALMIFGVGIGVGCIGKMREYEKTQQEYLRLRANIQPMDNEQVVIYPRRGPADDRFQKGR